MGATDRGSPYEPVIKNASIHSRENSSTRNPPCAAPSDEQDEILHNARTPAGGRRRLSLITGDGLPDSLKRNRDHAAPKRGLGPRPIRGADKLGMFSGVYVPTCLNVLSILMFLRFGFILGLSFTSLV
jgi:hypothetical protein